MTKQVVELEELSFDEMEQVSGGSPVVVAWFLAGIVNYALYGNPNPFSHNPAPDDAVWGEWDYSIG